MYAVQNYSCYKTDCREKSDKQHIEDHRVEAQRLKTEALENRRAKWARLAKDGQVCNPKSPRPSLPARAISMLAHRLRIHPADDDASFEPHYHPLVRPGAGRLARGGGHGLLLLLLLLLAGILMSSSPVIPNQAHEQRARAIGLQWAYVVNAANTRGGTIEGTLSFLENHQQVSSEHAELQGRIGQLGAQLQLTVDHIVQKEQLFFARYGVDMTQAAV
ncbi:hypothetical protein MKZ38_006797 [Zalerion maritima]|uniref:Uncharacterized protein n=1 Tax=Zalerion maritima TaxID=339359 RepID=A0AAD5WWQ1_9PEZI|nr:hypothetical protein MKZ38_006797 [Zalerion maritima]